MQRRNRHGGNRPPGSRVAGRRQRSGQREGNQQPENPRGARAPLGRRRQRNAVAAEESREEKKPEARRARRSAGIPRNGNSAHSVAKVPPSRPRSLRLMATGDSPLVAKALRSRHLPGRETSTAVLDAETEKELIAVPSSGRRSLLSGTSSQQCQLPANCACQPPSALGGKTAFHTSPPAGWPVSGLGVDQHRGHE